MNPFSWFLEAKYSPLPTTVNSHSRKSLVLLPKRYIRLFFFSLATSVLVIFLLVDTRQAIGSHDFYPNFTDPIRYPDVPYPETRLSQPSDLPPLYEEYRHYEDQVTEWNLQTYQKESDTYLYMSSLSFGTGWGNIMQEMVFTSLLASASRRGLVWDEYIWNDDGSQYSQFNGKTIPSKIPLSAMIAGHIVGLPISPGLPPSIPKRVYDRICPHSDRLYLDEYKVKELIGLPKDSDDLGWHMPGQQVLDAWLSLLNSPQVRDKKCVQITGSPVFTIWVLHTPRLHSMVNTLFSSPVVINWGWSELVKGIFRKNVQLFLSARPSLEHIRSSSADGLCPKNKDKPSLQGDSSPLPLLVLHLRRGDFEGHCQHLTKYRSTYVGMVTLPEFDERDKFDPPNSTYGDDEPIPEDASRFYGKHCYPDVTQIKERVREVLHDYEKVLDAEDRTKFGRIWRWIWRLRWYGLRPLASEKVKKVYIMSNGKKEWLDEVKKALMEDAKLSEHGGEWEMPWSWEDVGNSRELIAGWEEKPVLQLTDMYVGQRAELFIGNGFSTMTSNIVMLRKHNGFRPVQTRLW